jgi:broad specificity phosphatase PhoE
VTRFLLVRHGETEWTRTGRIQGQLNIPLTPLGVRQAERLRDRLRGEAIDAVYASDLGRAMDTAQLAVPGLSIEQRTALRECSFGEIDGRDFAYVQQHYPALARRWLGRWSGLSFPGGESVTQVLGRTSACFRELRRRHRSGTVLVVAHSGPLRSGVCTLMGWGRRRWWDLHLSPASLTVVETRPPRLILFDDTSHLDSLDEGDPG